VCISRCQIIKPVLMVLCVCVCVCARACACMHVRERERERENYLYVIYSSHKKCCQSSQGITDSHFLSVYVSFIFIPSSPPLKFNGHYIKKTQLKKMCVTDIHFMGGHIFWLRPISVSTVCNEC
jgi:hypothetical protein